MPRRRIYNALHKNRLNSVKKDVVTTRPEDLCFAIFFAGLNSLVLRKVIYFLYYDLIITQG